MTGQTKPMEPPAPVDDGWWASVLAEEERHKTSVPPRPLKVGPERNGGARPQAGSKSRTVEKSAERTPKIIEVQDKPPADWPQIQKLFHSDEIVNLMVTGYNRGGLLCSLGRLQAVRQASGRTDEETVRRLQDLLG